MELDGVTADFGKTNYMKKSNLNLQRLVEFQPYILYLMIASTTEQLAARACDRCSMYYKLFQIYKQLQPYNSKIIWL